MGDGLDDGEGFGGGNGEKVTGGGDVGGGVGDFLGDGVGEGEGDGDADGVGESVTCWTAATGWVGVVVLGSRKPVAASAVPAAAMNTAAAATTAALAGLTRRYSGIFSTVIPPTPGGPPDGHSAASSSAASPRWDRPRCSQSGPYAPTAAACNAATKLAPSTGRRVGSLAIPASISGRNGSGTCSKATGSAMC